MLQIVPQALHRTYTMGAERNIVPASVARHFGQWIFADPRGASGVPMVMPHSVS